MCKISVIVPVYNVEKYIKRCVESILNQTFKDYELILIDDGSTDQSGKICDQFVTKYTNVRCYHKRNGGLSDARNYGIEKSKSEYITFIDSDDYVSSQYLECLYKACVSTNSKISVCLSKNVYSLNNDENCFFNLDDKGKIEVYSGNELIEYALKGEKGSLSAWGKLYDTSFFENKRFPVGCLYEDMKVIYEIFLQCDIISFVNSPLYFYFQRPDSIVHSKMSDAHLYGIESCIEIYESELNRSVNVYPSQLRIVRQACGYLPTICRGKNKYYFYIIKEKVKPYLFRVFFNLRTSNKDRLRMFTFCFKAPIAFLYGNLLFGLKSNIRKFVK